MEMREYFDRAFEDFRSAIQPLADCVAGAAKIIVVYATIPLWIVPYMVYRKIEERKQNHA